MAWIESWQELGQHPKTRKAARLLGVPKVQVIGHLHCLWWWALSYQEDGDLTGRDPQDIADAAEWEGEPERFIQALVECKVKVGGCGFLENDNGRLILHNWMKYAGRLIQKRKANRDRANKVYAQSTRSLRAEDKSLPVDNAQSTRPPYPTVPYPTVPNRTEQNRTKETVAETIPLHSAKPTTANGKERSLGANAPKAVATLPPQPLQPYESAFLETFEFRSGRYPTKAMREVVEGLVEKYGEAEFLAAAKIAAGRNIRKLPFVEGILKRSGANSSRAGPGPPHGGMQKDFEMIDDVMAMIDRGESFFGH